MWECTNCSELIEDEIDVCWNCQTAKDGSPPEAYFKPKERVPRELADLQERMLRQTDGDLLRIVSVDSKDYRKEAIDLARAELDRRGVPQPPSRKLGKKVERQISKPVNEKSDIASATSNICLTCATPLDEDAIFCPLCAAPVTPDDKINCPSCGKSVSAQSLFCKYCAAELTSKKEQSVTPPADYSYQAFVQSQARDRAEQAEQANYPYQASANSDEKFELKYLDIWAKSSSPPSYFVDRHPTAVECVRCKELERIGACPNCGSSTYKAGYGSDLVAGLFCVKCSKGRTRWTCRECGTDNAMANTFGQLYPKGFCFIATATFESIEAPEVIFLREFRDEVLLRCLAGRTFVDVYYKLSPPMAKLISHSQILKRSSRIVLSRLVQYLKWQWRR